MRYVAYLQRFDNAHTEIASSNVRSEVVDAAIRIYSSLTSEIISRGHEALRRYVEDERELDGDEDYWRKASDHLPVSSVSMPLRAQEWNISVYEVLDPENLIPLPNPELIFSIGATLEDPSFPGVNR